MAKPIEYIALHPDPSFLHYMCPVSIGEPERIENPVGGTVMSSAVWGAPGAPPVILLHGFLTNALLWRRIGPTLSAEGYRAFAPDLLGFGKSGDPTKGTFGVVDQGRYVHQFISALGLRDVVIVGHDIGGGVAQQVAAAYPEVVLGLILVNTIGERNWPPLRLRALGAPLLGYAGAALDLAIGFERVLRWAIRSGMRHPARLTQPVVEAYASPLARRGRSLHLARIARDLSPKDTAGLAGKISAAHVPTLVVWGADDPYLNLESGRRLAASIENARIVEIPDCGHFVPDESPFELAEAMLPFLSARVADREMRTTGRLKRSAAEPTRLDRRDL